MKFITTVLCAASALAATLFSHVGLVDVSPPTLAHGKVIRCHAFSGALRPESWLDPRIEMSGCYNTAETFYNDVHLDASGHGRNRRDTFPPSYFSMTNSITSTIRYHTGGAVWWLVGYDVRDYTTSPAMNVLIENITFNMFVGVCIRGSLPPDSSIVIANSTFTQGRRARNGGGVDMSSCVNWVPYDYGSGGRGNLVVLGNNSVILVTGNKFYFDQVVVAPREEPYRSAAVGLGNIRAEVWSSSEFAIRNNYFKTQAETSGIYIGRYSPPNDRIASYRTLTLVGGKFEVSGNTVDIQQSNNVQVGIWIGDVGMRVGQEGTVVVPNRVIISNNKVTSRIPAEPFHFNAGEITGKADLRVDGNTVRCEGLQTVSCLMKVSAQQQESSTTNYTMSISHNTVYSSQSPARMLVDAITMHVPDSSMYIRYNTIDCTSYPKVTSYYLLNTGKIFKSKLRFSHNIARTHTGIVNPILVQRGSFDNRWPGEWLIDSTFYMCNNTLGERLLKTFDLNEDTTIFFTRDPWDTFHCIMCGCQGYLSTQECQNVMCCDIQSHNAIVPACPGF